MIPGCQAEQKERPPPLPAFYDAIAADEDAVLRNSGIIGAAAIAIADKLTKLLQFWESKYKNIL